MSYLLGIIFVTSLIAIGFIGGRTYERIEWNKLIIKGVLPKPTKR